MNNQNNSLITEATSASYAPFWQSVPSGLLNHARDVALTLLRKFADQPSYVLGVTSALPGEGKSTISVALAEVMSTDFGLEVVLVDGNAERRWPVDGDVEIAGSREWLMHNAELDHALIPIHEKCWGLPLGTQPISSRDILQSLTRSDALGELQKLFSLVLIDLPDLANPAAAALASLCNGLVLVVRSGDTPVDRVREFLPLLENVTVHGVILNRHRSAVPERILRLYA